MAVHRSIRASTTWRAAFPTVRRGGGRTPFLFQKGSHRRFSNLRRRLPTCATTALLLCLVAAACGRTDLKPLETSESAPPPKLRGAVVTTASAPAPASTSSTPAPPTIYPLTGQIIADPALAKH